MVTLTAKCRVGLGSRDVMRVSFFILCNKRADLYVCSKGEVQFRSTYYWVRSEYSPDNVEHGLRISIF